MREDQARVQLKAAAAAAATRGSLIFHLDLAMALGAQALAEAGVDTDMLVATVGDDGYGVSALDGAGERLAGVRFAADGRPVVTHGGGTATLEERALAAARRTLIAERLTGAERETIVVIPRPRGAAAREPFEAYALAQPEQAGDVVLGIHWHATVTVDGAQVLTRKPLSRAALVLPSRGPEAPPFDIEVTHFGAVPSEIHSWASLRHGIALTVLTLDSDLTWLVEGERSWLR